MLVRTSMNRMEHEISAAFVSDRYDATPLPRSVRPPDQLRRRERQADVRVAGTPAAVLRREGGPTRCTSSTR